MKAAGFHGYLQACSKVSFLGGASIKQITRQGLWHDENNLDPMIRMESGVTGSPKQVRSIKAEAEQGSCSGLLSAR